LTATVSEQWCRSQTPPEIPLSPALRPNNNFRSTPIMVDGVLYASNVIDGDDRQIMRAVSRRLR